MRLPACFRLINIRELTRLYNIAIRTGIKNKHTKGKQQQTTDNPSLHRSNDIDGRFYPKRFHTSTNLKKNEKGFEGEEAERITKSQEYQEINARADFRIGMELACRYDCFDFCQKNYFLCFPRTDIGRES
jgi:hypothetical protein